MIGWREVCSIGTFPSQHVSGSHAQTALQVTALPQELAAQRAGDSQKGCTQQQQAAWFRYRGLLRFVQGEGQLHWLVAAVAEEALVGIGITLR